MCNEVILLESAQDLLTSQKPLPENWVTKGKK